MRYLGAVNSVVSAVRGKFLSTVVWREVLLQNLVPALINIWESAVKSSDKELN